MTIAFKCTASYVDLQQALYVCLSFPAPPRVLPCRNRLRKHSAFGSCATGCGGTPCHWPLLTPMCMRCSLLRWSWIWAGRRLPDSLAAMLRSGRRP